MEKKLWNIFHSYGTDGGFGDYVLQENLAGTVEATDEEIKEYLEKWNKPEIYDTPYDELDCHNVTAEEIIVKKLHELEPYSTDPNDWFNRGIKRMKEEASE